MVSSCTQRCAQAVIQVDDTAGGQQVRGLSSPPEGLRPPPLAPPGVRSLAESMYTWRPSISAPFSFSASAAADASEKLTCAKPRGRPSSPYAARRSTDVSSKPDDITPCHSAQAPHTAMKAFAAQSREHDMLNRHSAKTKSHKRQSREIAKHNGHYPFRHSV